MKRFVALVLLLVLVFSLVACGGKKPSDNNPSSEKDYINALRSEKHPFEKLRVGMSQDEVHKTLGNADHIRTYDDRIDKYDGDEYCHVGSDEYKVEFYGQKATMILDYGYYKKGAETRADAGLEIAAITFSFSNVEALREFHDKVKYLFTDKYGTPQEGSMFDDSLIWNYSNCEIEVILDGRDIDIYWSEW